MSEPTERAAWTDAANEWARHVTDCDPCLLGRSCGESDRLLTVVKERFAVVRGGSTDEH